MQRQRTTVWLVMGVVLIFGHLCSIGKSQQPNPQKEDQQKVDSRAQKGTPAARIDFKKELSLPFASLGTLGTRIDAARRGHDPVALAHTAHELAVAEKVSGKKARVTSSLLMKEAAQLAKLRRQAKELQAVQLMADQVTRETEAVTDLKKEIALAQQQAAAETEAVRSNEQPTDTPRKVLVNNYTTQYIDIWVNGNMKMQLEPGQSKWCVIEHKWNPTILTAYGDEDDTTWGPRYIWGKFTTYTWNLN